MKNFQFLIKDDELTIIVDLKQSFGLSKSGRSVIVSCTDGNVRLFDENGFRPEKCNLTISKEPTNKAK
jgi:hypothetical protein